MRQPRIHLGYLDERHIIAYLMRAREKIRFVGPGMLIGPAQVVANLWPKLGPRAIEIVLDADSDPCRLGYCDGEALRILSDAASEMGVQIQWQPGIRLCVLEVDQEQFIFAPTPRLVEGPRGSSAELEFSLAQGESLERRIIAPSNSGPRPLDESTVLDVTYELHSNPPQPFDLARQVRVLSTQIQFVEFHLQGGALSRKRVPVPPDLLGLGSDPITQELLRASFRLLTAEDETSGQSLTVKKEEIEREFLITIPNYGKVILRSNRADFDDAVNELEEDIHEFRQSAESKLEEALQRNCAELIARLLPAAKANLPTRWRSRLGANPTESEIRARLESDLKAAFGSARDHLSDIHVRLLYKDVTVEMLKDKDFAREAARAKLDIERLYEEYEAARARP